MSSSYKTFYAITALLFNYSHAASNVIWGDTSFIKDIVKEPTSNSSLLIIGLLITAVVIGILTLVLPQCCFKKDNSGHDDVRVVKAMNESESLIHRSYLNDKESPMHRSYYEAISFQDVDATE